MFAFLAVGTFVGITLGLRFSVFILVPATLLAIAVIALIDIAARQNAGVILVTVFATAALLQIGYVVGRVLNAAAEPYVPAWTLMRYRLAKSELTNQNSEQHADQLVRDVYSQSDLLGHGDGTANNPNVTGETVLTGSDAPPIFDGKEKETDFDTVPSAVKRLRK